MKPGEHHLDSELPIDLGYLAEQTFDDLALQHELLVAFVVQGDTLRREIAGSGRFAELRAALHLLKGSARAIGAWAVADRAEEFEMADRQRLSGFASANEKKRAALLAALADACAFAATITGKAEGSGLAKQPETG